MKTEIIKDVTERVKTFEDACDELTWEHPLVNEYVRIAYKYDGISKDILAYLQLRIICTALNEGWEPEFSEEEYRYYPYFFLHADKELANKTDKWKYDRGLVSIDSYKVKGFSGFGCMASYLVPSCSFASVTSHLCLKSDTLATYCGKQFIDLWADYYLNQKK